METTKEVEQAVSNEIVIIDQEQAAPSQSVSRQLVRDVKEDCALVIPQNVNSTIAAMVSACPSDGTKTQRVDKFARAMLTVNPNMTAVDVFRMPVEDLRSEHVIAIERGIASQTEMSTSGRNGQRDAVRAVIKASWRLQHIDSDTRDRMLAAMPDEKRIQRDVADSTGFIEPRTIKEAFQKMADDGRPSTMRDAAVLSLMLGTGLRRAEVTHIDLDQLTDDGDGIRRVRRKGGHETFLFLPPGTQRHLRRYLAIRGGEEGPLFVNSGQGRNSDLTADRISLRSVESAVKRWFGSDVACHDTRRTFITTLLTAGNDSILVATLADHASPSSTALYDRRSAEHRRDAIDGLNIPFYDSSEEAA